jgi:hypothetical protein
MKEPLVSELTIPHASPLYHYPKDMSSETDVIENISFPCLLLLQIHKVLLKSTVDGLSTFNTQTDLKNNVCVCEFVV